MRCVFTMVLLLLAGCADLGYYWHSARGHMAIMNDREDIQALLDDPATEAVLRERLQLVLEIRRFARDELDLPVGGSYREYVALDRPWVVRNLFAAPEFSTELYQWCYPIVGCAGYRGYFDEARLRKYAAELEARGLDIYIGNVSAYSTLGWFDDPVLSSFIHWPDYRLAGLLFHELAHQRLFIDDDTTFNESFASAVQQAGTERWLNARGETEQLERFRAWLQYRESVITLIESTRETLEQMYRLDLDDASRRERKTAAFIEARARHAEIADRFGISGGFTRWFADDLNNAKIGSVSAYNAQRPAFIAILQSRDGDFDRFYQYVERLGERQKSERDACLRAWVGGDTASLCP